MDVYNDCIQIYVTSADYRSVVQIIESINNNVLTQLIQFKKRRRKIVLSRVFILPTKNQGRFQVFKPVYYIRYINVIPSSDCKKSKTPLKLTDVNGKTD